MLYIHTFCWINALHVLVWGPAQAHCVDTAAVVVATGHAAKVRTDQQDHVLTPFNIKSQPFELQFFK